MNSLIADELKTLIHKGKEQGFLTYDEVNQYLPDDDLSPERLDSLLLALDETGIRLIDKPVPVAKREFVPDPVPALSDDGIDSEVALEALEEAKKLDSDPIRMYLSQMSHIPLLKREEEISLAKKIEVSRKRFRRTVLSSDFAMRSTVETLEKVYRGELPFDRTIKVSLTEQLTKEQILARMPHNLKLLNHLLDENRKDFDQLIRRSTSDEVKAQLRRRFIARRRKCLQLVEELSLRTRRVQPLMAQLKEYARRMNDIKQRLDALPEGPARR
ncbi:MAG: RNA polymerase sigma factor region1.1 domain-containing protein [Pirellulaceae bacterium]